MLFARLILAVIFVAFPVFAQSPTFEVASVKPGLPPDVGLQGRMGSRGGPGTADPTLFTCENLTLVHLLRTAYNVDLLRISGPSWIRELRFNIAAKVPAGASQEDLRLMLQALLAERFNLAVHFEKKEMQIYELTVAKGGLKLKESSPDPAVSPVAPPPPARFSGRIGTRKRTMQELADSLIAVVRQPVIDATGLTGTYDTELLYSLSETLRGMPGGPPPRDPLDTRPVEDTGPDIFVAARTQLGLELKPKKAPVDVLVVDRAEKVPTEN